MLRVNIEAATRGYLSTQVGRGWPTGWYLHSVIRLGLQRERRNGEADGERKEGDSGNEGMTYVGQGYKKTYLERSMKGREKMYD